ncbi:MAG: biotin--[acetyl-CoA-carboxylase] ligase [Phycisphaerales bacterium]|nr:biotin--[acetyl-CoA-carboxylase] ligase [Phycisphaerales bacterium]
MTHGVLDIPRLRRSLHTLRIAQRVDHYDELASTNAHLLAVEQDTDVEGAVVLAEHQTLGRGRHGRSWSCPRGAGILCSVGVVDDPQATDTYASVDAGLLSLLVPVALCAGIRNATGVDCEIEWPNDIVHNRRKLSGILIEAHARGPIVRYAIGFGVNCLQHAGHFPPEIRDRATSLDIASPEPIDRTAVLAAILNELDGYLAVADAWDGDAIRGAWRRLAVGLGRRIRVAHDGQRITGHLVDIDPTAAIIVQLDEGGRRLFSATNSTVEWLD